MAGKLLMKRFGIKDVIMKDDCFLFCILICYQVPKWMKETDEDLDGRLSYKEFKAACMPSADDDEEKEET